MRRDPGLAVLAIALVVLLGLLFSHGERITSDGVDHYVYLRSLAVDRDLDLANDYEVVSPRRGSVEPLTRLGRTGNVHPIGPAILWAPFYAVADLLTRSRGQPADGWNPLYRDAVAVASLLYGWAGLVLVYLTARPEGQGPALLASLGLAFGTFLYWYLAFAPTMAHATGFAAAALFVWLWLRPEPHGVRRGLLLGAALGLAALNRWSSVLLVLLPAIEVLRYVRQPPERRALLRETLAGALAFLVVFSPQMIVWRRLYGSFLTVPQGTRFLTGNAAWDGVLFSPHHGLFSWSPLLYLGALGLVLFAVREPWRGLAAFAFLLALTRTNAGVGDWWGGSAFGGRRFESALPLFGLGLALAVARGAELSRRHPLVLPSLVVLVFVGFNLLVAGQYKSGAVSYSDPVSFEEMGRGAVSAVDRVVGSPFSLPGALVTWLRTGRAPADYESLYMRRPHARWTLRMGEGDRLFLEDGWGPPRAEDGTAFRSIVRESAGLVAPLHQAAPYAVGVRWRSSTPLRGRVVVNGQVVGSCELLPAFQDCTFDVPESHLVAGRNLVRLRVVGEGFVDVAGAWLEPAP
jgi:Dolichyl-phosphate-mannose-protein mannosyltransferase